MDKWLYYYIQHTNQATRRYNKSYWNNFELYFDRLSELDEKGYLKQQMYNRALNMVRELIRMEFERGNASFWEQLNDCKNNFSQKLFFSNFFSPATSIARMNFSVTTFTKRY